MVRAQLGKALQEVYTWCLNNQVTPHPGKSEAMLLCTGNPTGPITPTLIGGFNLSLLGLTVEHKLTWAPHVMDTKKSFVTKLDSLKRTRFLPVKVLRDFYFKVIVPSVKYGLVLWVACCDSNLFQSIERLHCRASCIIFKKNFNFPKNMASCDALTYDQWPTLFLYYKLDILRFSIKKHIKMASLSCCTTTTAAMFILYGEKTAYSTRTQI